MSSKAITSGLDKLKLGDAKTTSKKAEPADSWEDEADQSSGSSASDEDDGITTPIRPSTAEYPGPPPPTPASPTHPRAPDRDMSYGSFSPVQFDGAFSSPAETSSLNSKSEDKRPEKTTAVASRLIAAGLGQRAPKRTKEQREYDQAMKVQEKKKRDQAREAEEKKKHDAEVAKKAIWEDD